MAATTLLRARVGGQASRSRLLAIPSLPDAKYMPSSPASHPLHLPLSINLVLMLLLVWLR